MPLTIALKPIVLELSDHFVASLLEVKLALARLKAVLPLAFVYRAQCQVGALALPVRPALVPLTTVEQKVIGAVYLAGAFQKTTLELPQEDAVLDHKIPGILAFLLQVLNLVLGLSELFLQGRDLSDEELSLLCLQTVQAVVAGKIFLDRDLLLDLRERLRC